MIRQPQPRPQPHQLTPIDEPAHIVLGTIGQHDLVQLDALDLVAHVEGAFGSLAGGVETQWQPHLACQSPVQAVKVIGDGHGS